MQPTLTGRISIVTRRHVWAWTEDGRDLKATLASKAMDACVGDIVRLEPGRAPKGSARRHTAPGMTVTELLPRKNCLARALGKKQKLLAANVDHLLLVTAPEPLFNTAVIDRMLAAAQIEEIPCTIVVNKSDLTDAFAASADKIELYQRLGLTVLPVSAQERIGMDAVARLLEDPEASVIVMAGVSGVGKSSLLSVALPETEVRTREVSKTGQGRQTTSQAIGHRLRRPGAAPLMLVDLPGVQNFGICHLSIEQIRHSFQEFHQSGSCKFADCMHINEPECTVLARLQAGEIQPSRYASYRQMLDELERNREY